MLKWKHVKPTFSSVVESSCSFSLSIDRFGWTLLFWFAVRLCVCVVYEFVCRCYGTYTQWIANLYFNIFVAFRLICVLLLLDFICKATLTHRSASQTTTQIQVSWSWEFCCCVWPHIQVALAICMLMWSFRSIQYRLLFACLHTSKNTNWIESHTFAMLETQDPMNAHMLKVLLENSQFVESHWSHWIMNHTTIAMWSYIFCSIPFLRSVSVFVFVFFYNVWPVNCTKTHSIQQLVHSPKKYDVLRNKEKRKIARYSR